MPPWSNQSLDNLPSVQEERKKVHLYQTNSHHGQKHLVQIYLRLFKWMFQNEVRRNNGPIRFTDHLQCIHLA